NRDFVLELCQEWIASDIQENELFIQRRGWWKFKKPREQREYSHKHEWQEDIMRYLSEKSDLRMPYLKLSKKELAEQLNMPLRSLDRALIALKQEHKVFYRVKKGRGGGLLLASVRVLFASLIQAKKEEKEAFIQGIIAQFKLTLDEWTSTIQQLIPEKEAQAIRLFEVDTG
ncbi:replication protein RepR, partial [Enterococcus hirae]|nr:replication protein RepR [Enterococcus hirae]